MRSRIVVVTGVSHYLGQRLACGLAEEAEHVIGIDTVSPDDLGSAEFVQLDIGNPAIAELISAARVDTVVHAGVVSSPVGAGGRASMKETNIIGTMQLLAACQKAPSVRRLVLRSTTAVYGSSPRDPAVFTEEMEPSGPPRRGYAKDAVEVEGYVRGFARRRPDVAVCVLRFANVIGSAVDSALTRYFSLPVVPSVLGFDPRLQFCHDSDALAVLRQATTGASTGLYNVAGTGVLLLSQAIRRTGRAALPVPLPAVALVGQAFRRAGIVDFSPEQMRLLAHGQAVDVRRLINDFGYLPRYTTAQAFDDFAESRRLHRYLDPRMVTALEDRLRVVLAGKATVHA